MAERLPARGFAVNFELIHHLKEGTLILFRQGVRSIRAVMGAKLYEKSTQREAWHRIRHSPGHNVTGASLFFGADSRAQAQFSGDR
ncbi:MAG: hypothetical protein ACLQB4_11950 [Beijerinckiaceae bacterium]